jgi:hypothetical protein
LAAVEGYLLVLVEDLKAMEQLVEQVKPHSSEGLVGWVMEQMVLVASQFDDFVVTLRIVEKIRLEVVEPEPFAMVVAAHGP